MPALLFLTPFSAQSMGQEAADAKVLFEKKCSICHSADRAKSAKKTNEEWANTVTRMKNKTGNISVEEVKIIVDYLTKTYGK
jgi:nitrate/TMAO reductase-like tetraheme cytochrome c subunit